MHTVHLHLLFYEQRQFLRARRIFQYRNKTRGNVGISSSYKLTRIKIGVFTTVGVCTQSCPLQCWNYKQVNGRAAMASDSERRKKFTGPLWEGPHFCKFFITPTTDFIGYSKKNLKIHTGVPSPPFLPSLTFPSPSSPPLLPLPCLPLPLPLPLPSYIPLSLEVGPLKSS